MATAWWSASRDDAVNGDIVVARLGEEGSGQDVPAD